MNTIEQMNRIKRLKYRANHRGIKEMDIILGGFANDCLEKLAPSQIDSFEKLMAEHDRDLLVWFTGEENFPFEELQSIFELVTKHIVSRAGNA